MLGVEESGGHGEDEDGGTNANTRTEIFSEDSKI